MSVTWINYKGKKILFGNFSGLSFDDILKEFSNVDHEFQKINSKTRILYDFTDTYLNQQISNKAKELSKKHDLVIGKIAVVGITGIKKIIADGVRRFTEIGERLKYFNNLEDAKNFLVE